MFDYRSPECQLTRAALSIAREQYSWRMPQCLELCGKRDASYTAFRRGLGNRVFLAFKDDEDYEQMTG